MCVIISGFSSMAAQVILLREFFVVFYGNELSIGLILASWLFWVAIGSAFLGNLISRLKDKTSIFVISQLGLGLLFIFDILLIRSARSFLGISIGEMIGFFPMAIAGLIILAPVCILLGLMFSLASQIYQDESRIAAGRIGLIYMFEAIGAMCGGLLTSLIFIRFFTAFEIAGIFAWFNILAAIVLNRSLAKTKLNLILGIIAKLIFITLIFIWLAKGWDKLEQYSITKQWRGYRLLAAKNSIYGNIVVTQSPNQISFFHDGLYLYTVPDKLSSEEAVHFALLEHPRPQDLLIIGAGVGGLIEEALQHPLKTVDYMELDPLIIKLAGTYLNPRDYSYLKDSRVTIRNLDGRFFIKRTDRKYDCIITHLGEPYTAQLNRYYTVEFFREVKKILRQGGIFSFALKSSENYISFEQRNLLNSIYASLKAVFRDIKVIPGNTAYFLACDEDGLLTYDYKILMHRAQERKLDLKYVREYYLFSSLTKERISYLENALKSGGPVPLNYDFRPVSYYYGIIFWSTYFKDPFLKKVLQATGEGIIWKVLFGIFGVIFLYLLFSRKQGLYKKSALLAVMVVGFTGISLQVLALISFQVLYGYLFYKLGIILTAFMLGLTLGSWLMVKMIPRLKQERRVFLMLQGSVVIYSLVFPLFLLGFCHSRSDTIAWLGSNIFFTFLPIIAGFIGGLQFPLANKICLGRRSEAGNAAGLVYGIDLLGSCLGAFLLSVFLIPVLGIIKTSFLLAIINFISLILLQVTDLSSR